MEPMVSFLAVERIGQLHHDAKAVRDGRRSRRRPRRHVLGPRRR